MIEEYNDIEAFSDMKLQLMSTILRKHVYALLHRWGLFILFYDIVTTEM